MAQARGGKILFVEDDIGYQELAQSILSPEYSLTICSSAEDALLKLDAERFGLVIADINLFGMTGFELLDNIRQKGKSGSCPVIICSGMADPETRAKAIELGAAGFLLKPYPVDTLKALVKTLLGS